MSATVNSAATGAAATKRPTRDSAGGKAENGFLTTFRKMPDSRLRTRSSGLQVATVRQGAGLPLGKGMTISVRYTGWLEDGTKFDSSEDKGQPFSFRLGAGNVIKGWEEGLKDMTPGERRQLVIPAELAYGERQVGKIPPGATLIFNIEAISVERGTGNPRGQLSLQA